MTTFQILAVVLGFTALGGYINHKYMRLPTTIGYMTFALLVSLCVIVLDKMQWIDLREALSFVGSVNFSEVLLHGMLSFLLFAGALHIRLDDLRSVRLPVAALATIGVVLATFITGTMFWLAADYVNLKISYIHALLFGALISPTDPIAVLAILKQVGISRTLYAKIGGESLFNDGVGVVVFLTILGIASSTQPVLVQDVALVLLRESVGGLVLGVLLGWLTFRLLRSIDDYKVEVLLTLALVAGGYTLAEFVHVSAPICMVAAGLVIGNKGRADGMSDYTRERLDVFWELLDEILNAVLFMFIGFEIMVINMTLDYARLGLLAVSAVLVGRFISVGLPISLMRLGMRFERGTVRLLTWGGLRGGISIAMALSLPPGDQKDIIIPVTYIVVLFSILVQGLTFKRLVAHIIKH